MVRIPLEASFYPPLGSVEYKKALLLIMSELCSHSSFRGFPGIVRIQTENGGFFRKNGLIRESECVSNTQRYVL